MRAVQVKSVCGLFWEQEQRTLKVVPKGIEAGIPLRHQPMISSAKKFPDRH
jgi:hypothetical protein